MFIFLVNLAVIVFPIPVVFTQEMLTMSLACMELQLEQWSHNKGKNSECCSPLFLFSSVLTGSDGRPEWRRCVTELVLLSVDSPGRSSIGPGDEECDSEFPGKHFQGDLFLLALGLGQKDLFENHWLDVMVRVYWLKARFLALQVHASLKFTPDYRADFGLFLNPLCCVLRETWI